MAAAGKEIEIKLRVDSPEAAARLLAAAGFAVSRPRVFETNLLLDAAESPLRRRGEALRVRQRGGETILTFKGPSEVDRSHKSREEIETGVEDANRLLAILARLGFAPAFRYDKFRTEFARPGEQGVAMVDETPIGAYLELEGEGDWIDSVTAELGFSKNHYIIDSYSTMYRRYCQEKQLEIGAGMVFRETS